MVKFIIGNEREIEDKINEAFEELPNAGLAGMVTPYATPRGTMFCVLVAYDEKVPEEVKTDGKDTGKGNEKPDGEGKKAD